MPGRLNLEDDAFYSSSKCLVRYLPFSFYEFFSRLPVFGEQRPFKFIIYAFEQGFVFVWRFVEFQGFLAHYRSAEAMRIFFAGTV
jgi:hypothetical protein